VKREYKPAATAEPGDYVALHILGGKPFDCRVISRKGSEITLQVEERGHPNDGKRFVIAPDPEITH